MSASLLTQVTAVVRVAATNDRDGNPRRGWIVAVGPDNHGAAKATFVQEDYRGIAALYYLILGDYYPPEELREQVEKKVIVSLNITVGNYNRLNTQ